MALDLKGDVHCDLPSPCWRKEGLGCGEVLVVEGAGTLTGRHWPQWLTRSNIGKHSLKKRKGNANVLSDIQVAVLMLLSLNPPRVWRKVWSRRCSDLCLLTLCMITNTSSSLSKSDRDKFLICTNFLTAAKLHRDSRIVSRALAFIVLLITLHVQRLC